MKRTRMKQRSDSPAKLYYRAAMADRIAWKMRQKQVCMNCGSRGREFALECHEIASRAQAPLNWAHVANYLYLCVRCHRNPGTVAGASHAEQLAIKLAANPEDYNLERWLQIMGRAETYVTEREVHEWVLIHKMGY